MSSLLSSVNCCSFATDWFGEVLKQCESQCSCGCCSALRPRYKRLVDNIFPSNPQDGLVKSNMEKLTFYSLSSPEKLDRIGEYLARKVARDLSRHRNGYVVIAMDAMDQLLVSCHAQTLNLFVESFLKVVQQLLESQEPHMQLLATQSFVKFTNIEEDTPSYHRRYDFFVSKFSSLCHNGNMDLETRNILRLAGLNGLKGVIRKTVDDDLQANIFDETHMGKIVPSLLFNMQCQDVIGLVASDSSQTSETPGAIAEECLRELIGRAAFGHVHNVVKPMLKHLDNHQLWNSKHACNFAIHSFTIIMYSIQPQHSYAVIRMLMSHLDDSARNGADNSDHMIQVKTGIVNVLSSIVAISATESIGPGVLEMINSLLNHLRISINNCQIVERVQQETRFQETVINTLGEFANNLPDFQKIEILIFIISKAPPLTASSSTDTQLQHIILKSLLKVTTKYNTVHMAQAFPSALLNPLLSRALSLDPEVRLIVQRIFHQLLDRHNNLAKLLKPLSVTTITNQLTIEKANRQDILFMRKHISEISLHIYESIQFSSNTVENFHSIYATLALLCVELNSEETLTELLRLTFAMQEVALLKSLGLPESITAAIHCLVAGFLNLIGHLTAIPALCAHVEQVIKLRLEKCPYLLPERYETSVNKLKRCSSSFDELSDELLFNKTVISEALHSSGHDTNKLLTPFMSRNVVDSSLTRSASDLNTITVEVDSVNSSPTVYRRAINEEITYESLRKILTKPSSAMQEEIEIRRAEIIERFRSSPFVDLVARYEKKTTGVLQQKLAEVFSKLSDQSAAQSMDESKTDDEWHIRDNPMNPFGDLCNITVNKIGPPLFALKFPDLFVY